MWIIPKNYKLSAFAPDTVESKEDLSYLEKSLTSSLMWRSKPSPVQTWLRRWKRESWVRHLFGRTLKPCQDMYFETWLTSSLEGIRASRFQQQDGDRGQTTHGTCGHTSAESSTKLGQDDASLKTSKDMSASASEKSLQTWKQEVIQRRGEYSQRQKSALRTREKESSSWPTPRVGGADETWETAVRRGRTSNLYAYVDRESKRWPTPTTAEAGKISNRPNYGQLGLSNHPEVHGTECKREKLNKSRNGQPDQDRSNTTGNSHGQLNPDWVEQLMGLPTGWTDFDFSATE